MNELDKTRFNINLFKPGDRVAYVSDPIILDQIIQATKDLDHALCGKGIIAPIEKLKYAEGTVRTCHYIVDGGRAIFLYLVEFDDLDVNRLLMIPMQLLTEAELVPVMVLKEKDSEKKENDLLKQDEIDEIPE